MRTAEQVRDDVAQEARRPCACDDDGMFCRPCWAHYVLTGEDRNPPADHPQAKGGADAP
jgi:hypothetical protein